MNLSNSLKKEFILNVNGTAISNFEFLCRKFSREFLIELCYQVKESTLYPEEFVFQEESADQNRHLYFIQEGKIKLILIRTRQAIAKLRKNDYFGEISFFTNLERTASAQSVNFSDLFYIDRSKMMAAL
jgi:CRP-like cAMP-binding protein